MNRFILKPKLWKLGKSINTTRFSSSIIENNIVHSPTPDFLYPKANHISTIFKNIDKWSHKPAVECSITGRTLTYGKLRDSVARWGGFLNRLGISKGDVVAIVSSNGVLYPTVFLGTLAVGAIVSPMNQNYTVYELSKQFKDCVPNLVVCCPSVENTIKEVYKNLNTKVPLKIVTFGPGSVDSINIEDILNNDDIPLKDPVELTGDETMLLPYSSGTTGLPKGTVISHTAFNANILAYTHPDVYSIQETTENHQEIILTLLPLFHVAGIVSSFLSGLTAGTKLIIVPKFDPNTFIEMIMKHKIGYLATVPMLLNFLVAHPSCNSKNFSHLHTTLCGAAPVSPTAVNLYKDKVGHHTLFQEGYGLTECLMSHIVPVKGEKIGWMGTPTANCRAKIIDSEGNALPADSKGEICIQSPAVMKYYLNRPEETKSSFTSDGWLRTGDIGLYDNNGYFKIIDREKELIKVQGFQVSPSEIEDIIRQHPSVQDVCVVGIPNEKLGEAPKAFIISKGNISAEEIIEFVHPKVAPFKKLVGGVVFVKDLPKTGSGKIMRRAVKEMKVD